MIKKIDFKKINLNQIISLVILVAVFLIALKIFQSQGKKNAQIRLIQNEQKKKNEILLRIADQKKKNELYRETFRPRDKREIINRITNLAKAAGVRINSLKPQEEHSRSRKAISKIYNEMFFNLAIEVDSYHQLGKFISSLESDPMMFMVGSLWIGRDLVSSSDWVSPFKRLRVDLVIMEIFFK